MDLCGRYRISHILGIGGTAAVYAGVHRNGHRVAIKILHERLSASPHIERLFRREAQLANTIDHPGIVPVLDDDVSADGCTFLVMPLLLGETLRARAQRSGRKLPLEEVMVIAHKLLAVVGAAHAAKIVHRDLKPENLFLTNDGQLRVLDFGIGRFFETNEASSITRSGRAIGTPAFMAPEQALGRIREIDGRTDLWAIGATLFTLLSGRFVHEAESGSEVVVLAATQKAPPLASVAADIPTPICEVVDRALTFEKDGRWQDAGAMDRALIDACERSLGVAPSQLSLPAARIVSESDLADATTEPPLKLEAGTTGAVLSSAVASHGSQRDTGPTPDVDARAKRATSTGLREIALPVTFAVISVLLAIVYRHDGDKRSPTTLDTSTHHSDPAPLNPRALAYFNAGVQLWLDMSHWEAQERFAQATEVEPTFARAHLYYVLVLPWVDDAVRLHYRAALDHRAALDPMDRLILDALGPSVQESPDVRETEQRLTRIFESSGTVLLAAAISQRRLRLDRPADSLSVLARIDTHAESPALEAHSRGEVALFELRPAAAKRDFLDCLEQSPSASSCLRRLTGVQARDGACEDAEALSRKWIAAWPENRTAYGWLAASLYGRTQSVERARSALERKWSLTPEKERATSRASDVAYLSVHSGDLASARSALDEWEQLASATSDTFARGLPASLRLELEYDVSPLEDVKALTRRYVERSAAWSVSPAMDFRVTAARMLLRTGAVSEGEVRRDRDGWLADDIRGVYASSTRRWFNFFAELAVTPGLAKEAVEQLPRERPFFDSYMCDNDCESTIGETFVLAGDPARALPHLERAAAACTIEFPFKTLRARQLLGHALESLARPNDACDAYRTIVTGWWSRVSSSQIVRDAASRMKRLKCMDRTRKTLGQPAPIP